MMFHSSWCRPCVCVEKSPGAVQRACTVAKGEYRTPEVHCTMLLGVRTSYVLRCLGPLQKTAHIHREEPKIGQHHGIAVCPQPDGCPTQIASHHHDKARATFVPKQINGRESQAHGQPVEAEILGHWAFSCVTVVPTPAPHSQPKTGALSPCPVRAWRDLVSTRAGSTSDNSSQIAPCGGHNPAGTPRTLAGSAGFYPPRCRYTHSDT